MILSVTTTKSGLPTLGVLLFLVVSSSCSTSSKRNTSQEFTSLFIDNIRDTYLEKLDSAIFFMAQMDTSNTKEQNQELLLHSRQWYKRAEPFLIAFDKENYKTLNAPNLLKVDIDDFTDIKRIRPQSYQVLEEVLFGDEELELSRQQHIYDFLEARLKFIHHNNNIFNQKDRHFLKMIRDAIISVPTTSITGFDSPVLVNSLLESQYVYETIRDVIQSFEEAFQDKQLYEDWINEINHSIRNLKSASFDEFDRYAFIKNHTNKQLRLINATAHDWEIVLAASRPLNPLSENLFDSTFFNHENFTPRHFPKITKRGIELGRRLFNDPNLSKDGNMSCGSCHIKSKSFTDGHAKAKGNDGSDLLRNTPTVSYAIFQRSFFYDGRAGGLEGQILDVLGNDKEFHIDFESLTENVKNDVSYVPFFDSIYNGTVNQENVRNAIATYIRSLAPFNSKFDRNILGEEESLTSEEIDGFNLFMGKAACATCHFPPTFNGLVPPRFLESETENLGVPANASFENPVLDEDPGAFYPYKVQEKRGFFKTPTVRNIALTAPYMHNGVYATLEEVVAFYNVGGGAGMGLDVPFQTLPEDSLQLSNEEQKAIIAFMKSLTDEQDNK